MLPDEVCPRSPLASAVIVKNTFIDMEDEDDSPFKNQRRRSESEPPSRGRRRREKAAKVYCDTASSTSSGSPREETSGSEVASEEESKQGSVGEVSPSPGLNPNAPVWSPTWSPAAPLCMPGNASMPVPPPSPVFYQMPTGAPTSPGPSLALQGLSLPSHAFNDQGHILPPPPPPPLEYPLSNKQSRLNANAKAWQPGAPVAPSAPPLPPADKSVPVLTSIPNHFRTQMELLLEASKKAVSSNPAIVGVDVCESSTEWGRGMSIVAWSRRQDVGRGTHEQILKLAKDALAKGAENSQSVYVMGYKAKPFQATEFGFSAVLGGMNDDSKACWDAFSKGACQHEWDCRWQHAACQLPIQVEIRFRDS